MGKKAGKFYLGYKPHARCDSEGYLEALNLTPANAHESQHLEALLDGLSSQTQLQVDKGYASKANRKCLQARQLKDGIMYKAVRGNPLTDSEKSHNRHIKQTVGTLNKASPPSNGALAFAEQVTLV